MVCPAILAGIEEWNVSALKITRDVWPFVVVTEDASIVPLKLNSMDPLGPIL
jgi:hypothetical protein